jgi:hypothetical protein
VKVASKESLSSHKYCYHALVKSAVTFRGCSFITNESDSVGLKCGTDFVV